jgi:hypothetical protein
VEGDSLFERISRASMSQIAEGDECRGSLPGFGYTGNDQSLDVSPDYARIASESRFG